MLKVNTVIMDDLSDALLSLGEALKKTDTAAEVPADVITDARIHSFLTAHRIFEEAISTIFESANIEEDDDCECDNVEHGLTILYAVGILSEDQHKKLTHQREVAHFLSLDRAWLEDQEDLETFDHCIENINNYYYLLCSSWRDLAVLSEERNDEVVHGH